jgi:hypothetical protein
VLTVPPGFDRFCVSRLTECDFVYVVALVIGQETLRSLSTAVGRYETKQTRNTVGSTGGGTHNEGRGNYTRSRCLEYKPSDLATGRNQNVTKQSSLAQLTTINHATLLLLHFHCSSRGCKEKLFLLATPYSHVTSKAFRNNAHS